MNHPTIEITISPTGETNVETKGFAGSDCQQASRFLEQALGAKQSERLTPEFYLPQLRTDQRLSEES